MYFRTFFDVFLYVFYVFLYIFSMYFCTYIFYVFLYVFQQHCVYNNYSMVIPVDHSGRTLVELGPLGQTILLLYRYDKPHC